MPSFEEARATILDRVSALGSELVITLDAVGRVLAADVIAPWDMPLWDNSAMDGYAVRAADATGRVALAVKGYIPAGGHSSELVAAGTAAKILTGAPLPPWADAIVPIEDAEERDGTVLVKVVARPGPHV